MQPNEYRRLDPATRPVLARMRRMIRASHAAQGIAPVSDRRKSRGDRPSPAKRRERARPARFDGSPDPQAAPGVHIDLTV